MGLLDNFWDDTIAGPRPDKMGLGKKQRKYDSLPVNGLVSISEDAASAVPISRSITIVKPKSLIIQSDSGSSGSVPSSPAGSSTPTSPFSPRTPRSEMKRLSRRKSMSEAFERAEPRSPTVYDWVVISALDR